MPNPAARSQNDAARASSRGAASIQVEHHMEPFESPRTLIAEALLGKNSEEADSTSVSWHGVQE